MPRARSFPMPTAREMEEARTTFEARESRDLFYRAATELIRLAATEDAALSLSEALAVLLQTWNRAFYQYRGGFKKADFAALESLLERSRKLMETFAHRAIDGLAEDRDEDAIETLFDDFERVLGPVGAAKSLHLLAPAFFPIWDRAIAQSYGLGLTKGSNGSKYVTFMLICQAQHAHLVALGLEPNLKRLDEFNYCKFTKGWI